MKNNLCIVTNESISTDDNKFYCDNIDLKSIPESLEALNYEIFLLGRKSKIKRSKNINIKNIKIFKSIVFYLLELFRNTKKKNSTYLVISITPFTFFAVLFLKLFRNKPFVYLRSDGYEEYKAILGFYGPLVYHFMFFIVTKFSFLIACRKHLLRDRKGTVVHPSQLNEKWFINQTFESSCPKNLLYVGRLRIEKGIFSLTNIINNSDLSLTIVTPEKNYSTVKESEKINIINFENKNDEIIKIYDKHSIFILPSYTEAHPQVLDEALARHKPVIIFEEISHVTRDRKGIFVSKRNLKALEETVDHIIKNYKNIINDIKRNILPTKKQFIEELSNILKR